MFELQVLLDVIGVEVKFSDFVVSLREISFEVFILGGFFEGIIGDFDLFQVIFDVLKDEFYFKKNDILLFEVKYIMVGMNENEEKLILIVFNIDSYEVIFKFLRIYGYVCFEVFMVNGEYLDFVNDYLVMGIEVYVEMVFGERFEGML